MKIVMILSAVALASLVQAVDSYDPPRLPTGEPDLQGIWTNATITNLERPGRFDGLVLDELQAASLEQATASTFESIDEVPEEGVNAGADVGGYNTFWMDPGTRVLRVDGEIRSSILVAPDSGRLPWRLGARLKMFQFFTAGMDGPEQRPLGERCIVGFGSTGGPPMLPVLYNNHYQIVQSSNHIMIVVEMNHDARIVRMGGEHLPAAMRPWLGDSVGRWDGDTLVVETTNFNPGQSFRASLRHQLFLTMEAVVTERFTRVSEAEILYRFTVDDPGAYTQPWTGELALRRTAGPIYEYACHEANYAMPGILRGARVQEALAGGED